MTQEIQALKEFYKAGYITLLEEKALSPQLSKSENRYIFNVSTRVDGREIRYTNFCIYGVSLGATSYCLEVRDGYNTDFVIKYNCGSNEFTVE